MAFSDSESFSESVLVKVNDADMCFAVVHARDGGAWLLLHSDLTAKSYACMYTPLTIFQHDGEQD